jgi:FKBP-type peptidyl-prolyl cis-trans isomerase
MLKSPVSELLLLVGALITGAACQTPRDHEASSVPMQNSSLALGAASPARVPDAGSTPARMPAGDLAPPADVASPPARAARTASGIRMLVLKRGHGRRRPTNNDLLSLHYTTWAKDGSLVATSRHQLEPERKSLRRLPAGVAETVSAMREGEVRRAWIPARLAARTSEDGALVPSSDLTYDLELSKIIAAPPTPASSAPRGAKRLSSGVSLLTLEPGSGTAHPSRNARVTLHYSAWTAQGELFESTLFAGQPLVHYVRELLPGLAQAISQMVVGEKTRLWIPSALAYGDSPKRGAPRGPLVYEAELLDFVE